MTWKINYTHTATQQLKKLDKTVVKRIISYLDERVAIRDNPRTLGKALTGSLGTYWRFRVGNYRVICDIQDSTLCILVVQLGNRKDIYRE